ncbi:MAG: TFIIB-type zinc ribbon-containing protein [Planctomycetota bacterium]|jgi:phage FluMu protein Com
MIKFACENCGRKIAAQDKLAGKRVKCPKCRNVIFAPTADEPASFTSQSHFTDVNGKRENSNPDLSLLDIPDEYKTENQRLSQDFVSGRALEDTQELGETEQTGRRRLSWPIDIFLYPVSTPGLIILAIIILIPLFIDFTAQLLGPFGIFISAPGFVIKIIIGLYMYWYFCECIRDSAKGGVRAPDVLVNSPGLADMLVETLRILGCLVVFAGPPYFYLRYAHRTDLILYSLLVYAVFFFPMGLLAVIMFDSFSGLNPVLLVGSILSTFFQYCGLILLFCILGFLFAAITSISPQLRIMAYAIAVFVIYLLMVVAHLLGRFYWKYQEKLNWGA